MHTPGDEELAVRMFAGDEEAARELLERYRRPLYSLLYTLTRSTEDADDVFQETFLRAIRAGRSYDSSRKFKPWLYAIALNLARDLARRRQLPQDPKTALPEVLEHKAQEGGKQDSTEDVVARSRLLNRAIDVLPEEQRTVVVLRFFHGLKEAEIAEAVSIPGGTVKSRLHHALKKLRELVSTEDK